MRTEAAIFTKAIAEQNFADSERERERERQIEIFKCFQLRRPRGIQKVLQAICTKQKSVMRGNCTQHKLQREREQQQETERQRERMRGSVCEREREQWEWACLGQTNENTRQPPLNTQLTPPANNQKHLPLWRQRQQQRRRRRRRHRKMRRNSCAITFILFRRLLCQSASQSADSHRRLPAPHNPPTTTHYRCHSQRCGTSTFSLERWQRFPPAALQNFCVISLCAFAGFWFVSRFHVRFCSPIAFRECIDL